MNRKTLALGASCVTLAAAGTAVAAGGGTSPPAIAPTEPAVTPATVPAQLARTFDAFAKPVATSVPDNVRAFARSELIRERFAPNPALARAIRPPAGEAGPDWHLLPGDDGVCLFVAAAGTCTSAEEAETDGAWIIRFPKPKGKAVPGKIPGVGPHTLMGVLPAGTTGVSAVTDAGEAVAASVSGDAYTVDIAKGYVRSLRFTREDGSKYVGRFGRR